MSSEACLLVLINIVSISHAKLYLYPRMRTGAGFSSRPRGSEQSDWSLRTVEYAHYPYGQCCNLCAARTRRQIADCASLMNKAIARFSGLKGNYV